MARAPSKSAAARARRTQDTEPADLVIELTWRGRNLKLARSQLGPGDDAACRAQTARAFGESFPFQGFVSLLNNGAQVGTDILVVILWMARRKSGEPGLQLQVVLDEVGTNDEMMRDLVLAPPPESEVLDVPESLGEGPPPAA